jgi:hypothetical protein
MPLSITNEVVMKVTRAKSNKPANFPHLVQHQNTENWNTHSAHETDADAMVEAEKLAAKYPRMPVRVQHCTGGPMTP